MNLLHKPPLLVIPEKIKKGRPKGIKNKEKQDQNPVESQTTKAKHKRGCPKEKKTLNKKNYGIILAFKQKINIIFIVI
jgi:hypothetical protein